MKAVAAYDWLRKQSRETGYLISTAEVLAWDQRTYIPKNGHEHRGEQMAVMAKLLHERSTDKAIGDCLAIVDGSDIISDPLSIEAVNTREWRRNFDKAVKVPLSLAVDLAKATSLGETLWEKTRANDDWASFHPSLERIVELLKEKAHALGGDGDPYDPLVDEYEPGETAESIQKTFAGFKDQLVTLVDRIRGSAVRPKVDVLARTFEVKNQKKFCRYLAEAIGYDLSAGRIDVAAHPFTVGIGPGDVRITTRYSENFLGASVFGTLHEAGHAIYEQGLSSRDFGTPAGQVASLGVHESQSRMWENLVGRSLGMWKFAFGRAQSIFPALEDVNVDQLYGAVNRVKPSMIRVEADEVTYNLHILLRFELEVELMRGDLRVIDLPDAWNEKMRKYLGLQPANYAEGVMQDVHWAAGLIGYFPTYTLGNLYAAQMFNKAEEDLGNLSDRFAKGDFSALLGWLREKVHELGCTYGPRDLIARATGAKLDSRYFVKYCEAKYGELYKL